MASFLPKRSLQFCVMASHFTSNPLCFCKENVANSYSIDKTQLFPDSPLTSKGHSDASQTIIPGHPDLIIISPMTRTIQTALHVFGNLISGPEASVEVQIWPELRESHDALCNMGIRKAEIAAKFPIFDFSECNEEWDYEPHSLNAAVARGERVRHRLRLLSETKKHIVVVTHRGFAAFMVQGERFQTCGEFRITIYWWRFELKLTIESRSYRFADGKEIEASRWAVGIDSEQRQDFGPTLLMPLLDKKGMEWTRHSRAKIIERNPLFGEQDQ